MAAARSSEQDVEANLLRCRTCLAKEVDELISLYCRCESQDKLVAEMLSDVARQMVPHTSDNLPQHVCDDCLGRLDAAYSLQQKVQEVERTFRHSILLDKQVQNVEECCRICQRVDVDELISVFCVSGAEDKLIANIMKDACGVDCPTFDDNLPQHICTECFEMLSAAYAFRVMILKSEFTMRNTMKLDRQLVEEANVWPIPGTRKRKSKLLPEVSQKFVPRKDEDMDPFIYLDSVDVDATRLMALFSTTEDAQYYEGLIFSGVNCCCGKLLEDDAEWQEHRRLVHTIQELAPTTKNKCDICYLKFQYGSQFNDHIENRDKKLFYRCKICNILTKEMRNLQLHFEFTRFHPILEDSEAERISFDAKIATDYEPPGTCCDCCEEFETGEALLEHTLQHHYPEREDHPMFQCMICYNSFSDKQSLLKHQLIYKGTRTYRCLEPVCGFRITDRVAIKKHVESGLHMNASMLPAGNPEPEITEFFCCFYLCFESFETYDALEQHCKSNHAEQRMINSNFLGDVTHNVCPLCILHFPLDAGFQRHLKKQRERNHACNTCGKKFFTRENLVSHEKSHAKIESTTFACDQCEATYVSRQGLEKHHRKIHLGIAKEMCTECGKRFASKNALKTHIKNVHMKLRPYKCKECPATFGSKESLVKHMIIHSNERPYKCSYCDNAYKHSSDVKRHEATVHLNERPFVCDLCEASFVRNRELQVHMTRHTKSRFLKCTEPDCDFSTNVKKYMRDHVREHEEANKNIF